jgi:signal transduction histidine kinase
MAEIHRAILSTLEIEEIVTTVLTRAHTLFLCDCVSFGVFESGSSRGIPVYTYVGNGTTKNGKVAEQIELSEAEIQRLLDNPDILSMNADEPLPQYLAPIARGGAKSFLVLPLLFEHGLLGVIAFGYLHPHSLTREDRAQARQLADQVAVAMANAQLIEVRKRAENALHRLNLDLEKRVKERTKELALINKHLQREVAIRKQTEQDLRQAKEEADIATRAKSEFLANMSHELRTPLNAIIGFNEMLVDKLFGDLNEEQEEYLKDMLESAHHLLSLINDILDLSKVEAGKLELTRSVFSLKDLLSRSLVIIKEKATNHGIKLSVEAQGLPEVVNADERKIKQIIYNLLSNALKFTPDGGSVNLSALSLSGANGRLTLPDGTKVNLPDTNQLQPRANENYVMISVADSGIGIKPEDQAKVFEPFEQVDNSTGRRYQGTGLGLALTKKLVELHDGRLWVESEGEGKGSTFNFTIQL